MKRHVRKKLKLTSEALRTLVPGEIAHAIGGLGGASAHGNSCNSCPCVPE
jgi:hypothetical protein